MCLTCSVGLTAGPTTAEDLTMGNVNPPRHGTSLASQQFIDKLAELLGGKSKETQSPLPRARRRARGRPAGPARRDRFHARHHCSAVDADAGNVGVPT